MKWFLVVFLLSNILFDVKNCISYKILINKKSNFLPTYYACFQRPREEIQQHVIESENVFKKLKLVAVQGLVLSSIFMSSLLPANAKPTIASDLYLQAETAIENTQTSYKTLESDWKMAKKSMSDIQLDVQSTIDDFSSIEKELENLQSLSNIALQTVKSSIVAIEKEINELRVSTGEKYDIAQQSAFSSAKPSTTAALFLNAQREAALLIEDGNILKSLQSLEELSAITARKSGDALNTVKDTCLEFKDVLNQHIAGNNELLDGIAVSSKSLKGVGEFKTGINDMLKSQEKYSKVIKSLAKDIKSIQLASDEISKSESRIIVEVSDEKDWESLSKLKLKQAKTSMKAVQESITLVCKTAHGTLDHILEASNTASRKQYTNKGKTVKSSEMLAILRTSVGRLENAEKSGKLAEKLLKEAKAQGEKEASVYLKYYQYAKASTSTSTGTGTVTAAAAPGKSAVAK